MPPKKAIAFGKIGSFGQLSISSNNQVAAKGEDGGFGKFGKSDDEFKAEPTTAVQEAMGFQGFGKSKAPAKSFDLESLVEASKQVARERNMHKISEQEAGNSTQESEETDNDVIGPPLPPPAEPVTKEIKSKEETNTFKKPSNKKPSKSQNDDDDDDDDDSSDDDADNFIPATLEVNLNHGTKPVSALSVDHSGARLVTGSVDYDVRLWDFAGMSSSLQSFRTIRPCER